MKTTILIITIFLSVSQISFAQESKTSHKKVKVTFMELGSVRCIPCRKMEAVMKSVKEKFGSQIKVEFHDVWTPEGKPYAQKYHINLIPTQIFFDENGKEYYRHEGYFPEDQLIEILKKKGVK